VKYVAAWSWDNPLAERAYGAVPRPAASLTQYGGLTLHLPEQTNQWSQSVMPDTSAIHVDFEDGKRTAIDLWHDWRPSLEVGNKTRPTDRWAAGAIEGLAQAIRNTPGAIRASLEGADRGAESLSARPFQGIAEALQNADDLGATELRVAIRRAESRRELWIVHDGEPVQLTHVVAMLLPWLTTKHDDPNASGRWGIGQRTLLALGGPLEIHCTPFHFRVTDDGPVPASTIRHVEGLYSPEGLDTLLCLPLKDEVDDDELIRFVQSLSSSALLFLRTVRRLVFLDSATNEPTVDYSLVDIGSESLPLSVSGHRVYAERLVLFDPDLQRLFTRYMVELPVSRDERRRHKSAGDTTALGAAVSSDFGEIGSFYDRLPLTVPCGFRFSINGQFDPDTARSTFQQNAWNEHRFGDLAELVAGVLLDCFNRDVQDAWRYVPIASEVRPAAGDWIAERVRRFVEHVQTRLIADLRLDTHRGLRTLTEHCYEHEGLEGLLNDEDLERIAPDHTALTLNLRDATGCWRTVMDELKCARRITPREALSLFSLSDDDLGDRTPEWFIAMAYCALKEHIFDEFLQNRSILLADESRVSPPQGGDLRSLVCRAEQDGLATILGLALKVGSAYLATTEEATAVASALRDRSVLVNDCESAEAVITALAARRDDDAGRLRLSGAQLIALRSAFEQVDEERNADTGRLIGNNIEIQGFRYDEHGRKEEIWVSPSEAYLPAAIDHERDSFAKAAHKAPGLAWLDPSYAQVLKRAGGRTEMGAQRLLVLLGTATAPRLVRPGDERTWMKRDTRPASWIFGTTQTSVQKRELDALSTRQTHLLNDRWSPDLDRTIDDICVDRNRTRRRERCLALLGLLCRSWERQYAGHTVAKAVHKYDGYWYDGGEVIATWLANAVTKPWLPNAQGALRPPSELCLPTPACKLAYQGRKSVFLCAVEPAVLRSTALIALRLREGPVVSDLVGRLKELRATGIPDAKARKEVDQIYSLLALACPADQRGVTIGDMAVSEFRRAFRDNLVLVGKEWCSPQQLLAGPNIFGRWGRFAPSSQSLQCLWSLLQIRRPDAADCISVMREMSCKPLAATDQAVVLETMRCLAKEIEKTAPAVLQHTGTTPGKQRVLGLDNAGAAVRSQLRRMPLWTGICWTTSRPVYAVENVELAGQLGTQVPTWSHGFASLAELGELTDALGVTVLLADDFIPVSVTGCDVADNDDVRKLFMLAVSHLRDDLVRGDEALYKSLEIRWDDLMLADVVVVPSLILVAQLPMGGELKISALAHVRRNPVAFLARSREDAGSADGGGRAISGLFKGDSQKVAWAWATMWQRAVAGQTATGLSLSSDAADEVTNDSERLLRLQGQAQVRAASKSKATVAQASQTVARQPVIVRPLKDLNTLEPDEGKIINAGKSKPGVVLPAETTRRDASNRSAGYGAGTSSSGPRSVLPAASDREQLALDAVKMALRLNPEQIEDIRHRRGIGADAIDELSQFYEIKMSSSEVPDEVTLTKSETDAASKEDFFLAIVSGIEEQSVQLCVRFIFNPLKRLSVRLRGEMTLCGIREVEALEYTFSKADTATPGAAARPGSVVDTE
jgi:hypothetical protein